MTIVPTASSPFQGRFSVPTRETTKSLDSTNGLRVRGHQSHPWVHDRPFSTLHTLTPNQLNRPAGGKTRWILVHCGPRTPRGGGGVTTTRAPRLRKGPKVHYSAQRHPI